MIPFFLLTTLFAPFFLFFIFVIPIMDFQLWIDELRVSVSFSFYSIHFVSLYFSLLCMGWSRILIFHLQKWISFFP